MIKRSLDGKWNLYYFNQLHKDLKTPGELLDITDKIECEVPGNVELDLIRYKLLPEDIYFGTNMRECRKYETYQWWYEKEFELSESELAGDLYLCFEGVDTIAEYYLNGIKIGESRNMLIPHRFSINEAKQKKNTLHVKIYSAILEEHNEDFSVLSIITNPFPQMRSVAIRKAPHVYGWDIMPRAVSAGLWRGVSLECRETAEFCQLSYYCGQSVKYDTMNLTFFYDIDCPFDIFDKSEIVITGKCGDSEFEVSKPLRIRAGKLKVDVKNPKLWWPKGYGSPELYDVSAKVVFGGKVIAEKNIKIGLRTLSFDFTDVTDGENGNFSFSVNGEEIFCLGTNWVSLDAFHSRDAKRYQRSLELLDDIGCNMVRMWGGNVYEDDEFYDFCDSHGIMVWQDFVMACNAYPHTTSFVKEIETEAIAIVKKLRNHPSIVLWSGDNECDLVMLLEGVNQNPNTNIITRNVLKNVVYNHDFTRPYLPSSPYFSHRLFENGNWDLLPENHVWGPRDYYKSDFYKHNKAHFISECGYHGCPSVESLKKFIPEDDIFPGSCSESHILHSTEWDGREYRVHLVEDQIIQLFGSIPDNMEDFVFASQISQAEAMKYFIERMRIKRPVKKGILWWNLIDGWPQVSDAVVGYYFDKKLAYDWIKQSQQPICIMIDEIENWNLTVVVDNITLREVAGNVKIYDADSGDVLFDEGFVSAKNSSIALGEIRMMYSYKKLLVIEWEIDGKKYFNHYISGQAPLNLDDVKKWANIIDTKKQN